MTAIGISTVRNAARLAPALALACALSGCNTPKFAFGPPPVDLTSPIGKEVQAATEADSPYPKFANVPATAPTDVRPANAWTTNIYDTLKLRREQEALAALYPQTESDPETFASQGRAAVTPPPASATPTPAATDAARARAKPPSPAQ